MTNAITIDGSYGEGGGQILRTALSLSMITGRPFRMENIRAGRVKPGLLRQHLTALLAAREVCSASVDGASVGSTTIEFVPGSISAGDFAFSIGTAGSTMLVLQTVLPALMLADAPSSITLEGGTHNTHAPSIDFLTRAFLPLLARMGPRVAVTLERHGFYPAGGGRVRAEIAPSERLTPIELTERGEVTHRAAVASVAGLPGEIAKRELATVGELLGWGEECLRIEQLPDECGPGNVLSIEVGSSAVTEVFTGFGEKGTSAESVASKAARSARTYLAIGAPVGPHLTDQLMLPLALARAGAMVTGPLTNHARTNAHVIERFLPIRFDVTASDRVNTIVVTSV